MVQMELRFKKGGRITQKDQVREHLERCGSITSWGAIQEYRITRLSEYINQLRQEGMNITTTWKSANGKQWGLYELVKD